MPESGRVAIGTTGEDISASKASEIVIVGTADQAVGPTRTCQRTTAISADHILEVSDCIAPDVAGCRMRIQVDGRNPTASLPS